MVRSKNRHVCNPGARRCKDKPWRRKTQSRVIVIESVKLPVTYQPEIKPMRSVLSRENKPPITLPAGHGKGLGPKVLENKPEMPLFDLGPDASLKPKPLPALPENVWTESYGAVKRVN